MIICEQSNTNQLFQEQHYQSLARADLVVKVDPEEKTRPDSGLEEEKDLKKKDLKEENLQREEEYLSREEEEDLRREEENQTDPNQSYSADTRFTLEDERNGNERVQTKVKRSQG